MVVSIDPGKHTSPSPSLAVASDGSPPSPRVARRRTLIGDLCYPLLADTRAERGRAEGVPGLGFQRHALLEALGAIAELGLAGCQDFAAGVVGALAIAEVF